MSEVVEEELTITGSLFSITLFEEKLMKNFLIISNKLKRLEGLYELQHKQKNMQKQFKFLTMKIDTIVQKMPKDSGSVTRNDVKVMAKDILFDLLNSNDEKLTKTKYHNDLIAEINKAKTTGQSNHHNQAQNQQSSKKQISKTSFTAGQALRESQRQKLKLPRESLQGILDQKQMEIVSQIIENKDKGKDQKNSQLQQINKKYEELYKIVQELRLGRGYASFLEREAEKFEKFEQFEQKSRQTTRRQKEKPIQLQGIKVQNVKGQVLKNGLLSEVQRMESNKQQIAKHEIMQRKTIYASFNKDAKIGSSKEFIESKDGIKQKDSYVINIKQARQSDGFKRSHSIRKLQKIQKRLKVDDMKDLNTVLREIQLRIQTKVSHDIFMGFVKDIQEKLQMIRLSRDTSIDMNQLRKNIFVLESKLQSVVVYLQSASQEDDAMLVKKQWTCISCDKGLDKYQGKVGQHLNWESIASKKISPNKLGAFGQTGQLAAKIRNLMDGQQDQQ